MAVRREEGTGRGESLSASLAVNLLVKSPHQVNTGAPSRTLKHCSTCAVAATKALNALVASHCA